MSVFGHVISMMLFGLEESIGGLRRDKVSIGGASASYSEAGEKRERLRRPRWLERWMHGCMGEVRMFCDDDEPSILMTPFLLSMGE